MSKEPEIKVSENAFGEVGEKHVDTILSKFVGEDRKFLFHAEFMGAKAHLLDFLVRLIDEEKPDRARAEYFFAQIKTIHSDDSVFPKNDVAPKSLRVEFDKNDVLQAQCMKAPVYLFAVDARTQDFKAYIGGISSHRETGIYRVSTEHRLDTDENKLKIRKEVISYFEMIKNPEFKSEFDNAKEKEKTDDA